MTMHLLQSDLAPALLAHLLQSTAFAVAAWLLTLALHRYPARVRFWIWMSASTSLGTRWAKPQAQAAHTAFYTVIEEFSQPFAKGAPVASASALSSNSLEAHRWVPWLVGAIWLFGCLVMLGRWAQQWKNARRIKREAQQSTEGPEVLAMRNAESQAGMRRAIPVLLTSRAVEPGIFGVIHPVLLWPAGLSKRLDNAQIQAIVAHEMEHVRRHDNLFSATHALAEACFWFHPLLYWIGSTMRDERERACDESVIERNALPDRYAESILKVCAFCLEAPSPCIAGVSGSDLKKRILRIMNYQSSTPLTYRFSRLRTLIRPEFANKENVAASAGIAGTDQTPQFWGPPALNFSGGTAALSDAQSAFNRNRTDGFSISAGIYRGHHNITVGGDLRKQQYNEFFQQDPRGTFTFTGTATGSDLADFLIGTPDTSSIAFGNADKYLRQTVYHAYANDDWRLLPGLTINAGARWEYGAPMTELKNRLVNLDVASGFAEIAPVLASDPVGSLTGSHYPRSLIRPDRTGIEPRIGISMRPIPASTLVIRAGFGVYHDTSVYLTPVLQLAQQAPLSKSVRAENSSNCPLTLAEGFAPCASTAADTFALDPNFRVGYAQTWHLAVQHDLPWAMQMVATYLGVKGTHGVQEYLPNSYPIGAPNPCPGCPSGFAYQTSGGNSNRQAGQLQLRRRLRSGFMASLLYTYSKSIDDDSILGGTGHLSNSNTPSQNSDMTAPTAETPQTPAVAQDWLDLKAERSLSAFDQRHLLNLQMQYTIGQGLEGRTLMSGWRGRILKEWTLLARTTFGTGLPESPIYPATVPGTGWVGALRPSLTGESINASHPGTHLNAGAYTTPAPGTWGNAPRFSITGPTQFSLDSALQRTFRTRGRYYLDARIDAMNLLNHVAFTSWDTTVGSTLFGQPVSANSMRSLQATFRLRF
jgi:beta-lactamase regulating signal transducer with metallopeptidase domain